MIKEALHPGKELTAPFLEPLSKTRVISHSRACLAEPHSRTPVVIVPVLCVCCLKVFGFSSLFPVNSLQQLKGRRRGSGLQIRSEGLN